MDTKSRVRTTDGIDGKDAVGLYLDGIARTPLLNAAEEVARQPASGRVGGQKVRSLPDAAS